MTLTAGTRLGPYQIVGLVGAGGMGEVYRARDSKLQRDVAIKILPEAFAADPERLARFEREAQVLASLNHTNVGAIYGLVETAGAPAGRGETPRPALVLEYVDGPTLADRIAQGPIPIEDALPIALQIAEALEAAHAHGVVHRDLKPANIKLRPDGVVKVLDFGLAKALIDAERGARSGPAVELERDQAATRSPTMMSPAATRSGVLLGTAAYMSPEQARGKPVDKRSDIWAFGGVLFEMLAGRRAFAGGEMADMLAAIITQEPDWARLPADVPVAVRRLLRRCLQKDPHDRLHDIADARVEIDDALEAPLALPEASGAPPRARWPLAAAGVALGMVLGAVAALLFLSREPPPAAGGVPAPATDAVLELSAQAPLALGSRIPDLGFYGTAVSLSADGRRLAYVGQSTSGTIVYLRELDGSATTAVAGTEGAIQAFFSPNGRTLGLLTNDKVMTVELAGGAPSTLCEAEQAISATWPLDDAIIVAEDQGRALTRVDVRGGAKSALVTPPGWWVSPHLLPDGKSALMTRPNGVSSDYADVVLVSLDGGDPTVLVRGGYAARYVPPGYLLFARAGSVFAARFDAGRRQLVGEPVRVAAGVSMESLFAQAHFGASDNGLLAYVPGGERAVSRLAWVDRQGRTEYVDAPPRTYGMFDLSDDGARLAVHVADVTDYVWLYDFRRREGRRVTTGPAAWPLLDADGTTVTFEAWQSFDRRSLMRQPLDGGQPSEIAPPESGAVGVGSWSPNGRVVSTGRGFYTLEGHTFRRSDGRALEFSPDGRWGAFRDSAAGRFEIFVTSIADRNVTRQFSVDGGVEPVWGRSGELFFRKGNQWLSSVVRTTPELAWDPPRVVFETDFVDTNGRSYDVSPDGQRLLVVKRTEPDVSDRIHIVTNWTSRLTPDQR